MGAIRHRLEGLSISQRLIVMCGFAVSVFVVMGVVGVIDFSRASTSAANLRGARAHKALVDDANAQWLTADDAMNMYAALQALRDPSQAQLAQTQWDTLTRAYQQTIKDIEQAKATSDSQEETELLNGLSSDVPTYQNFTNQMKQSMDAGDVARGIAYVTVDNADISQSLQDRFAKLTTLTTSVADKDEQELKNITAQGRLVLLIMAVVGTLLIACIGWIQIRAIVSRIRRTATVATKAANQLDKVSTEIEFSANETASQSQVVSAAAEQLSVNMSTVAAAIEEMRASVNAIASSAGEASLAGSEAVGTVNSTNVRVSVLGEASQEIGRVIEVITSIAEQTNLLALNATIEAARAGEAGKGFAVVANEVKELAKATAVATEDISSRISAIQKETDQTTEAIESISAVISRINDLQATIAAAVEEQTATANEISRNVNDAAAGTNEIVSNIVLVSDRANSTSESATETGTCATNVSEVSGELALLLNGGRSGAALSG